MGGFPRFSRAAFDRLLDRAAAVTGIARAQLVAVDPAPSPASSHARFALCWVAVRGLGASANATAKLFGGRHHTTVLHAIRRAEQLRAADAAFRALTDELAAGCAADGGR